MTPATLSEWMASLSFNKTNTAKALGITRVTLNGYLAGKYPIPKLVELACEALTNRQMKSMGPLKTGSGAVE